MRPFNLNVVLVRSIYDSNIGASARAMSNMGATNLILIAPQCEITLSAHQAAASGQAPLENRKTYSSWQEFYKSEPEGVRISFTARDGRGRQVRDYKETLDWLKAEDSRFQENSQDPVEIYLIFGPEDWGLSAEDLELTHFACSIPTYGANWSLNLAQAVLLALYTTRLAWGGSRTVLDGERRKNSNSSEEVFPEKSLKAWVNEMGFDTEDRRISTYTILKRMLLHNVPTSKELKILETVLQQGIRKLREYNELRIKAGLPAINTQNKEDPS